MNNIEDIADDMDLFVLLLQLAATKQRHAMHIICSERECEGHDI